VLAEELIKVISESSSKELPDHHREHIRKQIADSISHKVHYGMEVKDEPCIGADCLICKAEKNEPASNRYE